MFKPGDKVRIVRYGCYQYDKNGLVDKWPEIVDKEVEIWFKDDNQERYAVKGVPNRAGWYYPDQLEELF